MSICYTCLVNQLSPASAQSCAVSTCCPCPDLCLLCLWLHICNSSWHLHKLPCQAVTFCSPDYWVLLLLCLTEEMAVGCGLLRAPCLLLLLSPACNKDGALVSLADPEVIIKVQGVNVA